MTGTNFVVSLPDDHLAAALGDAPPGVEYVRWDLTGQPPRDDIDLVVTPYVGALARIPALEHVRTRLVQSQTLGYDGIADALPTGLVYANATSVHESSTAEFALALVLASQRGIDGFVRASARAKWSPAWRPSLADSTVLLVGYGGVGRAIEARLIPFEVRIVRVARTARTDHDAPVHAMTELPALLPEADVVIVAVPLDDTTTHLVDDTFLSSMRDGALLVNVARGRVADTEAVLRHARARRLRFALDVVDPEPLPDAHPLFTLENVIVTPHVGGASSAMAPRIARLVRTQIDRLRSNEEPLNVIFRT